MPGVLIVARMRTYMSRRLVVIAVILARNSLIRVAIFEIGFHNQLYWQRDRCVDSLHADS